MMDKINRRLKIALLTLSFLFYQISLSPAFSQPSEDDTIREAISYQCGLIKNDQLTTTATSLAQKLSGRVSGLNIRQNTGEPGAFANSINIRGFGEPLFVIDGIVRPGSADFQRLRAEEIEHITVLKDAAAAIYGLDAINGVILVTTKKGSAGKTKFVLSTTTGFSSPTGIPEMADAAQYYELRNDANVNVGMDPFISRDELAKWDAGGPGYESTNWTRETLLKRSLRQEHNLSASGGSKRISFFINLGMVKENGILQSGDLNYSKFNFRSNLSAKLTKNLTANLYLSGFTDQRNSPVDGISDIWRGTVSMLPIHTVYANGNPEYLQRLPDGQAMNPVAIAQRNLAGYTINKNRVFQTSMDLNYKLPFIKGLEFKGVAAYDPRFHQSEGVRSSYDLYDYRAVDDSYIPTTFHMPPSHYDLYRNSGRFTLQAHAIYNSTIAEEHHLGGAVVYETSAEAGRAEGIEAYENFFTPAQIAQAGGANFKYWGSEWQFRHRSTLGRMNYDYRRKYMIGFSARYDEIYRDQVREGLVSAVSGGWRISEEAFIRDHLPWISHMKIRGSYGNIKDVGVELGLFNHKLSFEGDLFQRDRKEMIANLFSIDQWEDRVRGFEFSFNHSNQIGSFVYGVSGNINFARTSYMDVESPPFSSSWERYRYAASGRWNDMVWMYNRVGQFQSEEEILYAPVQNGLLGNSRELPGDFRYEDLNGDGVIDGNDMSPQAFDEDPRTFYGLNFNASWRSFDLNLLFQGAAHYTARYTHAYATMFWEEGNIPSYFMDRWHLEDPYDPSSALIQGEWPAIRTDHYTGMLYAESDAWRRSASYVRLKNLELGYTFNKAAIQRIRLSHVRVYINLNNMLTLTDPYIRPFDPESSTGPSSTGWTYPIMRTVTLGVHINFQ